MFKYNVENKKVDKDIQNVNSRIYISGWFWCFHFFKMSVWSYMFIIGKREYNMAAVVSPTQSTGSEAWTTSPHTYNLHMFTWYYYPRTLLPRQMPWLSTLGILLKLHQLFHKKALIICTLSSCESLASKILTWLFPTVQNYCIMILVQL